ncbi:hypothetical protein LSAT2_020347 [Lamellibrachia satsuma]|nr:hypothetical protein LSAT2_020347 [Lamellibrachia satsuma]
MSLREKSSIRTSGNVNMSVYAAITVQKNVRMFFTRRCFLKMRLGITKLQAMVRGSILRRTVARWHDNVRKIQRCYRAHQRTRTDRQQLFDTRKAVRLIQNEWRLWKLRQGIE